MGKRGRFIIMAALIAICVTGCAGKLPDIGGVAVKYAQDLAQYRDCIAGEIFARQQLDAFAGDATRSKTAQLILANNPNLETDVVNMTQIVTKKKQQAVVAQTADVSGTATATVSQFDLCYDAYLYTAMGIKDFQKGMGDSLEGLLNSPVPLLSEAGKAITTIK